MTTDDIENNPAQLFPNDLKERYQDARLVGAGGMGRIFSVDDTRLDKRVAIKLLPPNNDNPRAIIRFQQEAKAVSKLNNRHIVQVMDFGFTEDREPFLVMELIDGEDLSSLVARSGPLPITRVVEIAIQICAGLEHAHANSVVHRDLKPSNVMLDKEDCVKILDFGLAKIITQTDEDWRLTRPGQPIGSVLYMSPEQFQGTEADERTDVYALGLVIYHMMVGCVPYENENLMTLIRRRREDAPPALPPGADDAEMCDYLNKIVRSALAINPDDRLSSMSMFKAELCHCLAIRSELQKVQTGSFQAPQSKKLERAPILILCFIIIIGSVLFFVFYRPQTPVAQKHEDAPSGTTGTTLATGHQCPPGFREFQDSNVNWWRADEDLPDEGMDRLKGSGVKQLSLMTNRAITDDAIHRIRDIHTIIALNLRQTLVSDRCIDDINNMHLMSLNIRQTEITEEGVMRLSPNPRLQDLDLKYLKLTNRALKRIVDYFPNLHTLNIGDTLIDGEGLKPLKNLKGLKSIYLAMLKLDDEDVAPLFLHDLDEIELAANPITHVTIEKIMNMKSMKTVILEECLELTAADIKRVKEKFPKAEVNKVRSLPKAEEADMLELYQED